MDKMLYISMTGASQNTLAQRAHANNLANLSSQDDFTVPSYILDTCIRPNAGDLAQQLGELLLQGQSWISDPYAVMLSPTEHLLYQIGRAHV